MADPKPRASHPPPALGSTVSPAAEQAPRATATRRQADGDGHAGRAHRRRITDLGLLGLLVVATVIAFAIAQSLKGEKSPIYATRVSKLFSPVCRCRTQTALISFRLRHRDRLSIIILTAHGHSARTLANDHTARPGLVRARWNGNLAGGQLAPDGVYRVRVDFTDADRSILLVADPIRLDTRPSRIALVSARLHRHVLVLRYRISKPAHALLYIARERVVYTRRQTRTGTITIALTTLKRRHLTGQLQLAALDDAGNRSPPQPVGVTLTSRGWNHTYTQT